MKERFEKVENNYGEFELIINKRASRKDLHAFILLDELFPDDVGRDLVCAAEHDRYWLGISKENIDKLTDEQILELTRCGVMYDEDNESLYLFS